VRAHIRSHPRRASVAQLLKSLPASVQDTTKQKAAGGDTVKVLREDDPDGRWNCEVFVQANGKESGFEVDPNGKFVKHHSE
jgi:hypothetical protein